MQIEKKQVIDFYAGSISGEEALYFLEERDVDFIFYGPRERTMGSIDPQNEFGLVFEEKDTLIFAVDKGHK